MKSLKESLFDTEKNITKDITFGDLFKFESFDIVRNITSRSIYQDLSKSFSVRRIKKITNIQGKNNNETIYKGLVHIIENIEFIGDPNDWDRMGLKIEIEKMILDLFQHSLSDYQKTVGVEFYNNKSLYFGDCSIFDRCFNKVIIWIGPDLTLNFIRK